MFTTSRLLIRRFQVQDYPDLFEYLSDPDVYRYEPGAPITLEQAQELTRKRAQGTSFLAVVETRSQKVVGHLYFRQIVPHAIATWELGYIFNPRYHNLGYASEAAGALLRYGFAQWGIHRVIAHCNPENVPSWKVMEKIGMRREGHFRKNIFFNRASDGSPLWVDSYEYAILEEDGAAGDPDR